MRAFVFTLPAFAFILFQGAPASAKGFKSPQAQLEHLIKLHNTISEETGNRLYCLASCPVPEKVRKRSIKLIRKSRKARMKMSKREPYAGCEDFLTKTLDLADQMIAAQENMLRPLAFAKKATYTRYEARKMFFDQLETAAKACEETDSAFNSLCERFAGTRKISLEETDGWEFRKKRRELYRFYAFHRQVELPAY